MVLIDRLWPVTAQWFARRQTFLSDAAPPGASAG